MGKLGTCSVLAIDAGGEGGKSWSVPYFLGAGLVYLMGFYPPVAASIHDVQRFFVSAVLAAALLGVSGVARGAQLGWLLALVAVTGLATVWHPSPTGAALYLSWLGLLPCGWYVYRKAGAQPQRVQRLWLWVAAGMALAYAVRTGAAIAAAVPQQEVLLAEIFLGFGHLRHFAQLIPLLLPVLAFGCLPSSTAPMPRAYRPLAMLALLGWCILLWLNGSAGAFYGSLIGVAFAVAIAGWERSRPLVLSVLLAGVAAVLVILGLDYFVPLIGEIAQSARVEDSGRLVIWADTFRALMAQPLLGWGPDRFPAVVDARPAHPHNAELAFAMDFGLIALALLLVVMWRWFSPVRLARRIRAMPAAGAQWPVALTAAAFGGLAHAQVSGVTVMPLAQLVLAITLSLLLASVAEGPLVLSYRRAGRVMGGVVGVALAVAVLASALLHPCGFRAGRDVSCSITPAFWAQYPKSKSLGAMGATEDNRGP